MGEICSFTRVKRDSLKTYYSRNDIQVEIGYKSSGYFWRTREIKKTSLSILTMHI